MTKYLLRAWSLQPASPMGVWLYVRRVGRLPRAGVPPVGVVNVTPAERRHQRRELMKHMRPVLDLSVFPRPGPIPAMRKTQPLEGQPGRSGPVQFDG